MKKVNGAKLVPYFLIAPSLIMEGWDGHLLNRNPPAFAWLNNVSPATATSLFGEV